jgi:peptidoglycan/xylan/chitin deacetylase (PgdA/CDA1 family)
MHMGLLDSAAAAQSAAYKQIRSKRKIMRLKFAIGFAALTVGTALASVPAVAQQQGVSGYSSRGAVVAIHPYRHHRLYNYAPQRTHRHTAKTPDRLPSNNNGGM